MKLSSRIPPDSLNCSGVQERISLYMDSMLQDSAQLEEHLALCAACRKELESMTAVRNLLASSRRVAAPENLALEARVRLSRVRYADYGWRLSYLFSDFLKPMALRAAFGASVTTVMFGVLLIGLISNQTLVANAASPGPLVAVHQPVRAPESATLWLAGTEFDGPPEYLLIEAYVDDLGRAYDYQILEGSPTPEVNRWVWDRLYYAQFLPATSFGVPIKSSITLSFTAKQAM
ncbi:MAG TPA: zf-HC2 domain-containing protein [Terriglobia bacterium]|nr:zf-HC2 domain-containing protein [Terriglobia bacterium]